MKKVMLIAGEPSGDLHGGMLMETLRALAPDIAMTGIGGPCMRKAGLDDLLPMEDLSFMGIWEVAGHWRKIRRALEVCRRCVEEKPALIILIDFPDFNFRIAQFARKSGVPVLYYVAPQVWAWRARRAYAMKEFVDHLACVFAFEKEIFSRAGLPCTFVGHPLLDRPDSPLTESEFRAELGLMPDQILIGLLPGSRRQEIEKILPVMLKSAEKLLRKHPRLFFALSCAPSISADWIRCFINAFPGLPCRMLENRTREIMRFSRTALVTSGTATLETALEKTPMAVVYKTSGITYSLIRPFVHLKNISLVNILAGESIVPEFMQFGARPQKIADALSALLQSPSAYGEMRHSLEKVQAQLGEPGASVRVAQLAKALGKL